MCVVSNIGDDFSRRFPDIWPYPEPPKKREYPPIWPPVKDGPTQAEFDALKREVEKLKRDLIAGKKQDEEEGNPDCEMEDKVALLKKIAEAVGVDLTEVFGGER